MIRRPAREPTRTTAGHGRRQSPHSPRSRLLLPVAHRATARTGYRGCNAISMRQRTIVGAGHSDVVKVGSTALSGRGDDSLPASPRGFGGRRHHRRPFAGVGAPSGPSPARHAAMLTGSPRRDDAGAPDRVARSEPKSKPGDLEDRPPRPNGYARADGEACVGRRGQRQERQYQSGGCSQQHDAARGPRPHRIAPS